MTMLLATLLAATTVKAVGVVICAITLIGFAGLYLVLGILFVVLVMREVGHGPRPLDAAPGH